MSNTKHRLRTAVMLKSDGAVTYLQISLIDVNLHDKRERAEPLALQGVLDGGIGKVWQRLAELTTVGLVTSRTCVSRA